VLWTEFVGGRLTWAVSERALWGAHPLTPFVHLFFVCCAAVCCVLSLLLRLDRPNAISQEFALSFGNDRTFTIFFPH
jgi:hypothetical protein